MTIFDELEPEETFRIAVPHREDDTIYTKVGETSIFENAIETKTGEPHYINPTAEVKRTVQPKQKE